jgi:hypothetical protein
VGGEPVSRTPSGHGPSAEPMADAARVRRLDRWAWLLPPAVGLALFLLGNLLFTQLARFCGPFIPGASCPTIDLGLHYPRGGPSAAEAFAARVPAVPPAMLLVALSVATLVAGSVRFWTRGLAGWPPGRRALVLAVTWAAALAAGLAGAAGASGFFLTRQILGGAPFAPGVGAATSGRLDFLTFAAVVILLAGFARTLAVEPGRTEWDDDDLADRIGSLQVLLFLAAGLLVLNVAAKAALYRWGLSLAAKDDAAKLAEEIVAAVTTAGGAAYTLVLAGIYGSALLVLRRRVLRLAAARSGESTPAGRRKWMEERDLSVPVAKQAANLVATLSPLLAAGPLAAFTRLLGG